LQPARAVLKIDGEHVAEVEYRPEPRTALPFVQAERTGVAALLDEAGQLCPSCGFAHALALCQAIEALAGVRVQPRAAWLRTAAAELERAASHLATLAAIFETLGLAPLSAAVGRLAGELRAARLRLVGERPGAWLLPGGLSRDLEPGEGAAFGEAAAAALGALFPIAERQLTRRSLLARTVDVGTISEGAATQFGLAGPLARAAGLAADLRRDAPYAAYAELVPDVAPQEGGDVYARILVLLLEALDGLKLVERVANELPNGPWCGDLPAELPAGNAEAAVEAPRGPLRYRVESNGRRITSVAFQAAPGLDRLLIRTALANATLDDVPLIIVSTDPCDSCLR
jgi:Ni,Fe-hydrogenase III large subunit